MTQELSKDELFAYLSSEDNVHGLDPVAAHGFLCASVVGKPMPNWLSLFFENQESAVDDGIKSSLIAWRQELIDTLKNEDPIELPFDDGELDLSDEGDIVAWSIGFVDAMYADEDTQWFDDADTEEDVASLTLPMIVLSGIADDDEGDLAAMRQDEAMMVELVNSLEANLTELFLLFHTND